MFNIENLKDDSSENKDKISVEKLENFVNILENGMNDWLNKFEWKKDDLFESKLKENDQTKTLDCPFNPGHKNISLKNFDKHVNKCKMKDKSYTKKDIVSDFMVYTRLRDQWL